MDQEPQADQKKGGLDLSNILLPKKEISTDSAQRVDASVLMAQEQTAAREGTPPEPAQNFALQRVEPDSAQQNSASAQTIPPSEEIAPLQTFQRDIASVVQDNRLSAVSIAAAEADRRTQSPLANFAPPAESHLGRTILFVSLGLVLLLSAGGLAWYTLLRSTALSGHSIGATPYIATDGASIVTVPAGGTATSLMQQLTAAKTSVSLSLGLVSYIYIEHAAVSTDAQPTYMTAQELLATLDPSLPDTFVRTIQPVYVLGVHSFGVNQPFLILKVDSYEQAYAGMLSWERTMHADLSPLFSYTPAPNIKNSAVVSTGQSASTAFIATDFTDKIIRNHDARILQTTDGSVYFLWTFLDRSTIVITTNADTLGEVISRLTDAPVLAVPQQ